MQLPVIDLLNGLSALLIIAFSIVAALIVLSTYLKESSKEKLVTMLALLIMGLCWLGVATGFVFVLLTGQSLWYVLHFWLQGWAPVMSAVFWTYLCFSIVKTEWRARVTGFMVVLLIINLFLLFVLLPFIPPRVEGGITIIEGIANFTTSEGGLLDTTYKSGLLILIAVAIAEVVFIVGPVFFWFAGIKADDTTINAKGRLVGVGISLFGIFGAIDAFGTTDPLFLLFVRSTVILSAILIVLGFALPDHLAKYVVRKKS